MQEIARLQETLRGSPTPGVVCERVAGVLEAKDADPAEVVRTAKDVWNWAVTRGGTGEDGCRLRQAACEMMRRGGLAVVLVRMLSRTGRGWVAAGDALRGEACYAEAAQAAAALAGQPTTRREAAELREARFWLCAWRMEGAWQAGQAEAAWRLYHEAKDAAGEDARLVDELAGTVYERAAALGALKAHQLAADWLDECLKLPLADSRKAEGVLLLARCLLELRLPDRALQLLQRAGDSAGDEADALLVRCYVALDRPTDASAPLRRLLQAGAPLALKLAACVAAGSGAPDLAAYGFDLLLSTLLAASLPDEQRLHAVLHAYLSFLTEASLLNLPALHAVADALVDAFRASRAALAPEALLSLAAVVWRRAAADAAASAFRTARELFLLAHAFLSLAPQPPDAIAALLANVALCDYHLLAYADAAAHARDALALAPAAPATHYVLLASLAHLKAGESELAAVFDAALAALPASDAPSFLQAVCAIPGETATAVVRRAMRLLLAAPTAQPGLPLLAARQLLERAVDVDDLRALLALLGASPPTPAVAGAAPADVEWLLAFLYNAAQAAYQRREPLACCLAFAAHNRLSRSFPAYATLHETRLLGCLAGAAAGVEGAGETDVCDELLADARACLAALREAPTPPTNPVDKLEATYCVVAVKHALLRGDPAAPLVEPALPRMNASVLELVGVACAEGGDAQTAATCLQRALEVVCKEGEVDVARYARLSREACEAGGDDVALAVVEKVAAMPEAWAARFPDAELEWLVATAWNRGNRAGRIKDTSREERWHSLAYSLVKWIGDEAKRSDFLDKMNTFLSSH